MAQTQITYDKLLSTAMDCLIKDPELNLCKSDVFPTSRLLRDLGMDDTAKLQLIMDLEKRFNVDIRDEEILNRKLTTLNEFCLAVFYSINGKLLPIPQKPSLLQRVKEYFTRQKD